MAHPNKFVSFNLNKSYGQHPSHPSSPAGNGRACGGARSGSGGGGGMVVLSRPRSSSCAGQKGLPKLSVPPPLNLPSLRKEHERFDADSARPRSSGRGSGSGSSATGWTRPSTAPALQDKDGSTGGRAVRPGRSVGAVDQQGGGCYVPPGARSVGPAAATSPSPMAEKAVVLRGEEFPSLRATLASNPQQKDASNKQKPGEEPSGGRVERPELLSPLRVRLQVRSSRLAAGDASDMDGNSGSSRGLGVRERPSKQDDRLPDPLPLVRLNHTSDWADDERDTGKCGFWRPDSSLVREISDGKGTQDPQAASFLFREPFRGDSFGRDLTDFDPECRKPSSWRTMQQSKDGFGFHEVRFDRNRVGVKPFGSGVQEAQCARRDLGPGVNVQQNGKNIAEALSVRGSEVGVRGRGDASQKSVQSKGPFSQRSKGISLKDPMLNFGWEKRVISSIGKSYLDDVSLDSGDPSSSGLIGEVNVEVLRRKEDMLKQAGFHDPFKESFEAELERVQRMQEQERQRVVEEKARITERAQRELEERERLAREEEERRWLLEEEAREAAQRAEQERLKTAKRAEEQKIAREEEKSRIVMEEERRKEAARRKLLELEARIARRQAEANLKDGRPTSAVGADQMPMPTRERDASRFADVGDWEDEERMVEHTTSTTSSDSLNLNKLSDTVSSPHTLKDDNLSYMEGGKHPNSWQKDMHESGNNLMHLLQDQKNGYGSSRQDVFVIGRSSSRKEHYGGLGAVSGRPSSKSGMPELSQVPSDFHHVRENRWKFAIDVDDFNRNFNVDSDLLENDKFGDGCSHGRPDAPYSERIQQGIEFDGYSSPGRSGHPLRQPRTCPASSMPSMCRIPFKSAAKHLSSSSFLNTNMRYQHAGKDEEQTMQTGNDSGHQKKLQHSEAIKQIEESATSSEPKVKSSRICDSQSSLSISSPLSSSTDFSHDELDESDDRSVLPTPDVGEQTLLRVQEIGDANTMETAYLVPHGEDEETQESVENDEDNDVYQEDEEGQEYGKNLDLDQKSDNQQLDVLNSTDEMDQMILGFDEGIQVRLPNNDELEKASSKCGTAIGSQATSVSAAQESISDCGCIMQSETAFSEKAVENDSYDVAEEAEKALLLDPEPSTKYSPNNVKATNNLEVPAQQLVTSASSSLMPRASLVELTLSSVTTVATQAEVPLKLQFGLFSGPSIPSPVPAFRIGSIQMPLHLHPQVGSSMTLMHSSQPPFVQFGQPRHAAPITQGILQVAPQTMPFLQPPASTHYLLSQNLRGSIHIQANQECSPQNNSVDKVSSSLLEKQPDLVPKPADIFRENMNSGQLNALQDPPMNKAPSQSQASSSFDGDKSKYVWASQAEIYNTHDVMVKKNDKSVVNLNETQFLVENVPSQLALKEKAPSGWNASGMVSGSKGKRFSYTARNAGSRSSFSSPESSCTVSSSLHRRPRRNFRRIEFRVQENIDGKQSEAIGSLNYAEQDKKTHANAGVSGISARYHGKKGAISNKPTKMMIGSEKLNSGASSLQVVSSDSKMDNIATKEASIKQINSLDNELNLKRNGSSEENVDAPLQSGVVRVFRQPGIEAPSGEDDFIQVRSKKQMLNDRREQREKEVKAKSSRVIKPPRKHRTAAPRNNVVISSSNKAEESLVGDIAHSVRSDTVISNRGKFTNADISPVFSADMTSQNLPPTGTPAVNVDADAKSNSLKPTETTSTISSGGTKLLPGLSFKNENLILDNASLPFGSWDNEDVDQQVMPLTQSQLDEAMKPAGYDSHVASSVAIEHSKPSPSVVTQEKVFPSSTSSLNSLLAGEEIQFGAFTSPSVLPPVSQCISGRIGPSGSGRTDVSMECDVLATNNNSSIFFDKEKQPDEPCMHLRDPEVEAEAAAAAAAGATSTNDEIVENRLSASSVSDSKTYSRSADATVSTSRGMSTNKKAAGQSAAVESLSVALPADLSVDTPSLPFWPPLPSPQSTAVPMLSNLPGAPPSQFPCFEVNPTSAGPYFAFGPHEEPAGTQKQPHKSTTVGSVPLHAWPQYHSNVDSFYVPPAGFSGPFISPGGIPGVPGPPHMVVYNHFTPGGQFGQVGLGFMGTTYIPTGKQPDWKHNTLSSLEGVGESGIKNLNVVSGQHNLPSMPVPIHHLVPGSPLMPMAPFLAMFGASSFQSSADLPMQARWSHIPAPPIYSVPLPVPLQQHQVEDGIPLEFGCSLSSDTSAGNRNRFNEPSSSLPAYGGRHLSVSKGMVPQLPDELTLVEPPTASTAIAEASGPSNIEGSDSSKSSARRMVAKISETGGSDTSSSKSGDQGRGHFSKPQDAWQSTSSGQQYLHPAVITEQRRNGASQNTGAGGDWHRRVGHQGRNQTSGPASSKMKRRYVAKRSTSGPATTG